MVPFLSMVNIILTIIIVFSIPVLTIIYFRGKKGVFRALAAGGMGYFMAQYLFRQPLLGTFLNNESFYFISENVVLYALTLGISAAVFEFLGRLLTLSFFMKRDRQKHHILSAGIGHGAFEAIFVVGFTYINNLLIANLINAGRIEELVSEAISLEQVQVAVNTFISTNSWVFLVAGAERVMTLVIHVAITLLVFRGIKSKKYLKNFGLAIGFHALLDTVVVILLQSSVSVFLVEVVIFAMMMGAIYIIRKILDEWKQEDETTALLDDDTKEDIEYV